MKFKYYVNDDSDYNDNDNVIFKRGVIMIMSSLSPCRRTLGCLGLHQVRLEDDPSFCMEIFKISELKNLLNEWTKQLLLRKVRVKILTR